MWWYQILPYRSPSPCFTCRLLTFVYLFFLSPLLSFGFISLLQFYSSIPWIRFRTACRSFCDIGIVALCIHPRPGLLSFKQLGELFLSFGFSSFGLSRQDLIPLLITFLDIAISGWSWLFCSFYGTNILGHLTRCICYFPSLFFFF